MLDLLVRDVRVRDEETSEARRVDLHVDGGLIAAIVPHADEPVEASTVVEGGGAWAGRPRHMSNRTSHLDAALTSGEPRWNAERDPLGGHRVLEQTKGRRSPART